MPDPPRASHDEPSTGDILRPDIESRDLDLSEEDFWATVGAIAPVWETRYPPKPPPGTTW